MKKHVSTILLVLVFFIGCSLMLYPIVSDWWNSKVQTRAVTEYSDAVDTMDAQTCEEILSRAESYNTSLAALDYPLSGYGVLSTEYTQALNLPNTDVMGYITIDKLNVKLPIYHGTSDSALAAGVGHLEGSSLPVGGASTHAVLSAHRGLPTSRLFTDLDKMEEGDTFSITVLNRTLTYQVDQILIVEPQDVAALQIVPGEDLCTLLTCTPYGINTHRLLVRGHRVDTPVAKNITIPNEATRLDSLLLAPVIAVPMLLVLLVYLLIRYRRRKPEGVLEPERASKSEGMRAPGVESTEADDAARQSAAIESDEAGLNRAAVTAGAAAQRPTPAKSGEMEQHRVAAPARAAAQRPTAEKPDEMDQGHEPGASGDTARHAASAKSSETNQGCVAITSGDAAQRRMPAKSDEAEQGCVVAPSGDAEQHPETSSAASGSQPDAEGRREGASRSAAEARCEDVPRSSSAASGEDAMRPSASTSRKGDSQSPAPAGRGHAPRTSSAADGEDAKCQSAAVSSDDEPQPSADSSSGAAAQPPEVAESEDASQFVFVENAKEVSPLLAVVSPADTSLDSAVTLEAILAFLADDAADTAGNAADDAGSAGNAASNNDDDTTDTTDDASLSFEEDDCEDVYLGAHFAKPSADRTRRNDRRGR